MAATRWPPRCCATWWTRTTAEITINAHPDSIYTGALGAAVFALDDLRKGTPSLLVVKQTLRRTPAPIPVGCADCSAEVRS